MPEEKSDMLANDVLERFIFEERDVRASTVRINQSLVENNQHQHYPPAIQKLLGEFMVACALLSSSLKLEGRVILQVKSEGEISLLMAECNNHGALRAYAQFDEAALKANPNKTFTLDSYRNGVLAMTIEPDVGEAYQGIVSLDGDDLASCLQSYFLRSEQLQSHFYLLCEGDFAVGFMLQQLPAQLADNEDVRVLHWEEIQTLAVSLTEAELLDLDGKTIMYRLFHEDKVRYLDQCTLQFSCSCSKERMERALLSLGRDELETILLEQGQIDILCEFCNHGYVYSHTDIDGLFAGSEQDKILH